MGREQQNQVVTSVVTGDYDELVQRARKEHPGARDLKRIAAAYAAPSDDRHQLWLDDQAGVLVFLERAATGDGGARLHEFPLRSASCARILAQLTAPMLQRLASPADSYRARTEIDRDIAALVELFRVQLARMRTEHSDPAELTRAIHAQIAQAVDEQQATRRKAFLGWYLEHASGNVETEGSLEDDEEYEDDGQDPWDETEQDDDLHPGSEFTADTILDWAYYRQSLRSEVGLPQLDRIPSTRGKARWHWYYEFRTQGRHLTEQQISELRAELPQARISSDSLVLDQWSDITEHPIFELDDKVATRFDAGLYFRQEGSRALWLRLPAHLAPRIAPYEDPHGWAVSTAVADGDLILCLRRHEEDGDYSYEDPRPWLEELLPLRENMAAGDVRAPAIAWRAANETLAYNKALARPRMPDGLDEDELTPQLHALIRLLEEIP